jgi:glycerol-3-phosphate dehydrogenase
MSRSSVIEHYRQNPDISVLIVGAGINGIGVFRELALNGIDALLVDRGDFCSGASAASSHMAHGGIRYLENGEFRLVREALVERNRLLQNAPHYVKPLPTTIPIFHWFSGILNAPLKFLRLRDKPGERGALIIKLGLILYDWFARTYRTMPTHRFAGRAAALRLRPKLSPKIVCTATYYDAFMPYPERICIELVLDSEAASTAAHALNYVTLAGASDGSVTLRDEHTGEMFIVRPRIVINAAGPWIDFANRAINQQTRYIGGTKGSHLVIDHAELRRSIADHEIFFENKDGRICLICPFEDKVLAGTTDIRIENPDDARCTEDEMSYILDLVKVVFPDIHVDRSHIVSWFTGVRPLPRSDASRTGAISRDHSIEVLETPDLPFPVLSLVGGKWTTFRAFAEQTADMVFKRLNRTRHTSTGDLPIGGGRNYPRTSAEQQAWVSAESARTGLPAKRIEILFQRYGTRAAEIAAFLVSDKDAPLRMQPDYSRREIIFLAQHEKIVHLDDLVLRRSLLALLGHVTGDLLLELAEVLAEALNWSVETRASEVERCTDILQTHFGLPAERLRPTSPVGS